MLLLRDLPRRLSKNGKNLESWGLFWCDYCKPEVERRLGDGKIAKSCGCVQYIENSGLYKHGESKTRLYMVWTDIKNRCFNPKVKSYKDYGGRGVTICPEWAGSYIVFRDWALNNGYQENLTIDRKDPNGNYEPSNCRWLKKEENSRYKRTTKLTLELANEIRELDKTRNYTRKELAIKFNVSIPTISEIINNKRWKK